MNIVTESKKQEKISSINDCLKPDSITDNLWVWAERLEKLGKILFWIIIISGFVIALSTSIVTTEVVEGVYYPYTDTETTFSFGVFLTSVVQTALYAFIEYCAYHVLALLIGALANITQNTKATARLTEYVARKTLKEEETDRKGSPLFVHNEPLTQAAIHTQASNSKDVNKDNPPVSAEISNGEKICPKCGQSQRSDRRVCWACGQQFDN